MIDERAYENHIRAIVAEHIVSERTDLVLMENKKAVDILICKNGTKSALYFIEVKFHRHKHGRLGFGGAGGIGFQPEILSKNPDYFSSNMRWIIGDEEHGIDRFVLLTNSEIASFVAGGAVGQKFNNIQSRLFRESHWLDQAQLIGALKTWVS